MNPRQPYPRQNSPPENPPEEDIIDIPPPSPPERRKHSTTGPPWDTESGYVIVDRRSHRERRKNWR